MKKIFIDGSEGTTGLRIFERFQGRDDIELIKIDPELRKDPAEISKCINASDITFLCLPDAAAIEAAELCTNPDTVIIDASTAHRTNPDWAYGFPELAPSFRKKIETSKRIAVPGCHASGFIALVYPLVINGLLSPATPISCFSLTGYSGGGKKMIAQYEAEDKEKLLYSPRQYGITQQHKHLKEMKYICGLNEPPVFSPIVDDYYSGMEVTVPLHMSQLNASSLSEVLEMYKKHYEGQKFVIVRDADYGETEANFYAAGKLTGFDFMEIMVNGNDDRIIVTARFDNLGKGASGAAVQCMNISMGVPEDTALILA